MQQDQTIYSATVFSHLVLASLSGGKLKTQAFGRTAKALLNGKTSSFQPVGEISLTCRLGKLDSITPRELLAEAALHQTVHRLYVQNPGRPIAIVQQATEAGKFRVGYCR